MRNAFTTFIKKSRLKSGFLFAGFIDLFFPFVYRIHTKKFTGFIIEDISRSAYIVSPLETLSVIENLIKEKKPGAYLRFGDGDIYLAIGNNDSFQKSTKMLGKEMNESFSLKGPGIIKSLIIHSEIYGYEREMFIGNHLITDNNAKEFLRHVYPFFVGHQIFSPIALHYTATHHPSMANDFLKLLKKETILFIGNEDAPEEIVRKLFGEVKHIKAPTQNSYDKIDLLEKEVENILQYEKKFGVVIISMGCSGRILMKRLYKRKYNIFLFDFGSLLDGICGNNTRTWLRKANIDYEVLLKDL
jgi:hypothetical protein